MKKLICVLICLMLPLTALAAPTRDARESVLSDAELDTLRTWLDTAVREALPVEYGENLLRLVRYIHMNPVAAGICNHPADYPYSSFSLYFRSDRYQED